MSRVLTAKTITWLERCERRVWLEVYGDRAQKVADSPISVQRAAAGLAHEAAVMTAMLEPAQPIEVPDWPTLVRETRRLMQEGVKEIRQAGLEVRFDSDLRLLGRPDVVRRLDQPSWLGPWSYAPVEIKQHAAPQPHDLLQLDLYRWMLGAAQGHLPDGELWLGARDGVPTTIQRQTSEPRAAVAQLRHVRSMSPHGEPAIWFSDHCQYCPWREACSRQAEERQDLALVARLNHRTAAALRADGITTLSQLAELSATQLTHYPNAGPKTARHILMHARALLAGAPLPGPQAQPALPTAALFLDLESHPATQEPWAFGWVDAQGRPGVALVAPPRPAAAPTAPHIGGVPIRFVDDVSTGWQQLTQLVRQGPGAIIHWSTHEPRCLTRTGPTAVVEALQPRMVDLHPAFMARYTLPIPRGATQTAGTLKAIGGYLGQQWPAEVDWSMSWAAYNAWRQQIGEAVFQRQAWDDGIDAILTPAIAYLLADVEALRRVWQWLKAREHEVTYG